MKENTLISAKKAIEKGFCTILEEKEIIWIIEKDTNEKLIGFSSKNDLEENFFSVGKNGKILSVFL